jgi:hypothetical protein
MGRDEDTGRRGDGERMGCTCDLYNHDLYNLYNHEHCLLNGRGCT